MQTPSSLKNIISVFFAKSKRERMDFTQRRERFLSASVQFLEKKLFSQKILNQGLTGMTNYGILLSRQG